MPDDATDGVAEHSFLAATINQLACPSYSLDVQLLYPMYYPEGMKVRVSHVQSIEPHRILALTRDLNPGPPGPESKVVTTILPLHTYCTVLYAVRQGHLDCRVTLTYKVTRECHSSVGYTIDFPDPET